MNRSGQSRRLSALMTIGILVAAIQPVSLWAQAKRLGLVGTQLIRCSPRSEMPCFRFDVSVVDAQGQPTPLLSALDKENVRVVQTSPVLREYKPFYVSGDQSSASMMSSQRYVLILFDVSGSMSAPVAPGGRRKIDIAKEAASAVLAEFSGTADFIAIAPFESHDVVGRISRAAFVSDLDAAKQQIQSLAAVPNGNTALYSSVAAGLDVLALQDSSYSKLLIVFTDGVNDIRTGDDPELLQGASGLTAITDRVRADQVSVYTIGLGTIGSGSVRTPTIDDVAMRKIAYPDPSNFISATDSLGLSNAFRSVTRQFFSRIRVTTMVDEDSFPKLTGGDRHYEVRFKDSATSLQTREWTYSPPVSGIPDARYVADAAERAAFDAALRKDGPPVQGDGPARGLVQVSTFILYLALISFLWFVVPRFLWPPAHASFVAPGEPVQPSPPRTPVRKHIEDPAMQVESPLTARKAEARVPDSFAADSPLFELPPELPPARTSASARSTVDERPLIKRKPAETPPASPESSGLTHFFKPPVDSSAEDTVVSGTPDPPARTDPEEGLTEILFGSSEPPKSRLSPDVREDQGSSSGLTQFFGRAEPPAAAPAAPVATPESLAPTVEPGWDFDREPPSRKLNLSDNSASTVEPGWDFDREPAPTPLREPVSPEPPTTILSKPKRTTLANTSARARPMDEPARPVHVMPPPQPAPLVKPTNTRFLLLVILNVVLLVGATLVLYFVLKR